MPLEGRSLEPFEQLVYVELSTESVDPLYWWSYMICTRSRPWLHFHFNKKSQETHITFYCGRYYMHIVFTTLCCNPHMAIKYGQGSWRIRFGTLFYESCRTEPIKACQADEVYRLREHFHNQCMKEAKRAMQI